MSMYALVNWPLSAALLFLGYCQLPTTTTTTTATAEEPHLSYTLRLLDGSPRGVGVTLTAPGSPDGRTVLAVAEQWAGVRTVKNAYPFDLGFDESASLQAKEIKGVRPGSAAHEAGLRDGQRYPNWKFKPEDPDYPMELTVEEAGARKSIRYLPRGPAVEVPFFVPASPSGRLP